MSSAADKSSKIIDLSIVLTIAFRNHEIIDDFDKRSFSGELEAKPYGRGFNKEERRNRRQIQITSSRSFSIIGRKME